MTAYPNLYFNLSNGEPGRKYKRDGQRILDNVLWKEGGRTGQIDSLKTDYRKLLTKFSDRFVAGFDYGSLNMETFARRE